MDDKMHDPQPETERSDEPRPDLPSDERSAPERRTARWSEPAERVETADPGMADQPAEGGVAEAER